MDVSIATALNQAADKLQTQEVDEPRMDAALLLSHTLGRDRTFLIAHDDELLSAEQSRIFDDLVLRRASGEPLQYLTGHQEFFKLDFEVTPDVLIPRPETELIVEAVLELFPQNAEFNFADVGTGSGCIAISILHERAQARATAIDKSARALEVARRNAARHQVTDRLRMLESDLFAALPREETFDLIVSNPPYIQSGALKTLQREVRLEPQSALDGGTDGLTLIRRLLSDAPAFLRARGYLVFEIGFDQEDSLRRIIDQTTWKLGEIRQDLQGLGRTGILRKQT